MNKGIKISHKTLTQILVNTISCECDTLEFLRDLSVPSTNLIVLLSSVDTISRSSMSGDKYFPHKVYELFTN